MIQIKDALKSLAKSVFEINRSSRPVTLGRTLQVLLAALRDYIWRATR